MSNAKICLVVDDEDAVRGYVRMTLEREGFKTIEAASGIEALRLVEKLGDAVDLIVSDIKMPDGDGITFVCAAREQIRWCPSY